MEFIIWLVFETIFVFIHIGIGGFPAKDPVQRTMLTMYAQMCINLATVFIFRKYLCRPDRGGLFCRKQLKYVFWGLVIGIGVCLGHRIFFLIFQDFVVQSIARMAETGALETAGLLTSTIPLMLYGGLLGPVTEELVFRGLIFNTARTRRGNLYAVIVSSLLFAIPHWNGVQFISALFMGLVIGYAVWLTDSVYIGVVIHTVNNSFSMLNAYVMNKFSFLSEERGFVFGQLGAGIVLLVFGVWMLRREARKTDGCRERDGGNI